MAELWILGTGYCCIRTASTTESVRKKCFTPTGGEKLAAASAMLVRFAAFLGSPPGVTCVIDT